MQGLSNVNYSGLGHLLCNSKMSQRYMPCLCTSCGKTDIHVLGLWFCVYTYIHTYFFGGEGGALYFVCEYICIYFTPDCVLCDVCIKHMHAHLYTHLFLLLCVSRALCPSTLSRWVGFDAFACTPPMLVLDTSQASWSIYGLFPVHQVTEFSCLETEYVQNVESCESVVETN